MRRNDPLRRLEQRDLVVRGTPVRAHVLSVLRPEAAEASDLITFVLVHGIGVSSRYFVPLAEKLALHGQVVIFDLPGFGGVPHPRETFSIADFADVVTVTLEELGVGTPVLIGHSMGAQVVVEALAASPDLAAAAMLLGPVVNADDRTLRRVARRFLQSSRHERPGAAALSVGSYFLAGLWWTRQLLPRMVEYPIEDRIGGVRADLVLMSGNFDATSPRAWLELLAEAATSAGRVEVVSVEGAAHQLVVDHADVVALAALELAGLGTGSAV